MNSPILETDVIPYPTARLRELKKGPLHVIEKGKEIFYNLVLEFKPSLIILHGKKTVEHVNELLVRKGLISFDCIDVKLSIEELEKRSSIAKITYPNGKVGLIMACRHFMYYGNKGDSFESFRRNVQENLKSDLLHITQNSPQLEDDACGRDAAGIPKRYMKDGAEKLFSVQLGYRRDK